MLKRITRLHDRIEHLHTYRVLRGDTIEAVAPPGTAPKPLTPERIQAISRVLADPRRFELLQRIAKNETSPCSQLRKCCPISAATLSHHLKELEAVELIGSTRRGKFVDAHFCREKWEAYLAALAQL